MKILYFLLIMGLHNYCSGFNETEFKMQKRMVPAAVKSSQMLFTSDNPTTSNRYLPERGGGDGSIRPPIGSRLGYSKIHYPVRGGYAGKLNEVKIGSSIYSNDGQTIQRRHQINKEYFTPNSKLNENKSIEDYQSSESVANIHGNSANVSESSVDDSDHKWKPEFGREGPRVTMKLVTEDAKSPEHRLIDWLFDGYNKNIRPTSYAGEQTHVFFELALFDILELNTKKREIIVNTEMIMKWSDPHLIWDPRLYEGVDHIRIPFYDIWYPDVILHNSADTDYKAAILNTYAIITAGGEIELLSHALLKAVCELDVEWYPFDQQKCQFVFASWSYDITSITLDQGPADVSDFNENPAYVMENFYAESHEQFNPCCPNPFSSIIVTLQIQRRVAFAMFFYIMPGILINITALLSFSLPSETGEKIDLGINSLLAMIVFLMAMTEKLPPTDSIPLAGLYYGVALTLITINLTLSVYVININFRGFRATPIEDWIKNVTLVMAKILKIKIPKLVEENWNYVRDADQKKRFPLNIVTVERTLPDMTHLCPYTNKELLKKDISEFDLPIEDSFQVRMIGALEAMAKTTKTRETRRKTEEKRSDLVEEWKFISRVLDRSLFIAFILVATFFNAILLTSSPFAVKNEFCPLGLNMCEGMTEEEIKNIEVPHAGSHGTADSGHGAGNEHGGGHGTKTGNEHGSSKGEHDSKPNSDDDKLDMFNTTGWLNFTNEYDNWNMSKETFGKNDSVVMN